MNRQFAATAAMVIAAALLIPTIVAADPVYLTSIRRVYVELGATMPRQGMVAPDNGPFSAAVSLTEGDLSASALQTSVLAPDGIFATGVTRVGETISTSALAINQLIVNFSLATAHAYSFATTMAGSSLGAYLGSTETGSNIFTVPGHTFANVSRSGVLLPGKYQFNMGLTSDAAERQGSFLVSLQLDESNLAPTPEPATLVLLGTGAVMLAARARRRRRHP